MASGFSRSQGLKLQSVFFLFALTFWCGTAAAASIEDAGLGLPLVCRLGETCWVANYVDTDPTEAARDFRCKSRTYNAHDGTDFAIRDRAAMEQGVPVVASAPGIILRVRDGIEDVALTKRASGVRIAGKECGNGVVINHDGGWQTQYCHLRRGSIRVRKGEPVERGAHLGLVGLSGKTEFPHVHLTVRRHGQVIDPFTGHFQSAGCGGEQKPLWLAEAHVAYEDVALYNGGFAGGQPDMEAIRSGRVPGGLLPPTVTALVLWVDIFGVRAGDRVRFRIINPDGRVVLDKEESVSRTQARRFIFAGQLLHAVAWAPGSYSGYVTLTRMVDGHPMKQSIIRTVTVQ